MPSVDYFALKSEIDTDPLARGYAGMTDQQVADDMNLFNRDAPATSQAILQYLTLERFRQGSLYGRLMMVALSRPVRDGASNWSIPPVPLGVSDADIAITQEHIAAANAILRYADVDVATTVTLLDTRFDALLDDIGPTGCEAIGANDKTALQALSQNQQSRAMELGIGGHIKESDVAFARSLP